MSKDKSVKFAAEARSMLTSMPIGKEPIELSLIIRLKYQI